MQNNSRSERWSKIIVDVDDKPRCRRMVEVRNQRRSHRPAPPLLDEEVALAGRYPSRKELARWAGITILETQANQADSCCSGGKCC